MGVERFLIAERAQLPLWIPALMGIGIATYFALPAEPSRAAMALPLAALVLWAGLRRSGLAGAVAGQALIWLAAGFALAVWRAHEVAAPVIDHAREATVEGRVLDVSATPEGRRRLLLDRVVVHGLDPRLTPARVRVTVLPEDAATPFRPGMRVMVHARLIPPGGPVEPGGFDFRRMAWFDRLGATGIARGVVLAIDPRAPPGLWERAVLAVAGWRAHLAEALRAALPGQRGSFAAAILVGDRSGIPEAATEALRASNLAHLLAISGLHMGLLTGFVFLALRGALALIPPLALGLPTRKLAAVAAMLAGLAYLVLSGAAVATQRSFVMVVVMFGAVLVDRLAITLRSVALAAVIILALFPESLVEVGFQMSFAATVALVAAWEALRRSGRSPAGRGIWRGAAALTLTSTVAGLATAPIAAYVFHRGASWGLPANLLAVPLMGAWIMPAGALAAPLALLGLEGPALWAMGLGIDVVLAIAGFFAALPGAVIRIPQPDAPVLVPIALGGLWLCLWQGRARLLGLAAIAAGLVWWPLAVDRPALLVTASGRQIGLIGPEGRALFKPRRDSWAVSLWLEADGDLPDPARAAARPGLERAGERARGRIGAWRIELVADRRPDPAALADLCRAGVLLIVPALETAPPGGCLAVTGARLRRSGALAVRPAGGDLEIVGALEAAGARLWSRPALPPDAGDQDQ